MITPIKGCWYKGNLPSLGLDVVLGAKVSSGPGLGGTPWLDAPPCSHAALPPGVRVPRPIELRSQTPRKRGSL